MRFNRSAYVRRIMASVAVTGLFGFTSTACEGIDIRTNTPFDAPVYGLPEPGIIDPKIIPDNYIVVLREGASPNVVGRLADDIGRMGAEVKQVYQAGTHHVFWAKISPETLDDVRRKNDVAWIEVDRYGERTGGAVQTCVDWNLDMLDHPSEPLATISPSNMKDLVYGYETSGSSAYVLVVDTGIRKSDTLSVRGDPWFSDRCNDDRDGHGTQVAAIIGDTELGVAKGVQLIPFNADAMACYDSGTNDKCKSDCMDPCAPGLPATHDFLQVFTKIRDSITSGTPKLPTPLLIVFPYAIRADAPNASFEGVITDIVNLDGIFVVSAGNGEKIGNQWETNACKFSPARLSDSMNSNVAAAVITVGAVSQYGKAGKFNTGPCVDVFAPGIGVRTRTTDKTACDKSGEIYVEGASFAAAHAAGVAAQLLDMSVPHWEIKAQLLAAARTMDNMGGLPGSTDKVLHGPALVNVVSSGIDAAQCKSCGGPEQPCCNGSPVEKCGSGLICGTDSKCIDCGAKGEPCCFDGSNVSCDNSDLICDNGTCADACVTTCCDDTKVVLSPLADTQCIRNGGDTCWNRSGPKEIRNHNATIWGPKQCGSLREAEAVCCDGTRIPLNPQFDENIAKEIAIEECNVGPDSKMRETYMGGQIVGSIFENGGTCGKCDVLCCDGTRVGGDFTWPGVSNQNACMLFGGLSCRDHGDGPTRIDYDGAMLWTKGTDLCPTNVPCFATCVDDNGNEYGKEFVGDYFDEGMCDLFAPTALACAPPLKLEAHLYKCANGHSCPGDMACVNGTCEAWCRVRCRAGHYYETYSEALTKAACLAWTESECKAGGGGDHHYVWFNGELLFNRETEFPGICGGNEIACCHTSVETEVCKSATAQCVAFVQPPTHRLICSECGGRGDRCCANDTCGNYSTCKPNPTPNPNDPNDPAKTCQPCGALGEECCGVPGIPPWCASGLTCQNTGVDELRCQVPVP